MKLFLGVDGGQTGTTALIGDETGRVLGAGSGGPANHAAAAEGRRRLERAVGQSVGDACAAAGLGPGLVVFEAACLGMSGGPQDKRAILSALVRAERLVVTTDAAVALAGAMAGGPGVVTIAGTGSIAFGRNGAGETARAGGWGYVFGDEGGAFDIVRQALRAALRAEEGWGPPTALRAALLQACGAPDANTLMHWFYGDEWPRQQVARLAPLVDETARAGDAAARNVLDGAAAALAALARAVRHRLWRPGEPVRVAWTGGVFRSAILRERFRALIDGEEGNRCGPPLHGPAAGALLEAYAAAGLRPALSGVPEGKQ